MQSGRNIEAVQLVLVRHSDCIDLGRRVNGIGRKRQSGSNLKEAINGPLVIVNQTVQIVFGQIAVAFEQTGVEQHDLHIVQQVCGKFTRHEVGFIVQRNRVMNKIRPPCFGEVHILNGIQILDDSGHHQRNGNQAVRTDDVICLHISEHRVGNGFDEGGHRAELSLNGGNLHLNAEVLFDNVVPLNQRIVDGVSRFVLLVAEFGNGAVVGQSGHHASDFLLRDVEALVRADAGIYGLRRAVCCAGRFLLGVFLAGGQRHCAEHHQKSKGKADKSFHIGSFL